MPKKGQKTGAESGNCRCSPDRNARCVLQSFSVRETVVWHVWMRQSVEEKGNSYPLCVKSPRSEEGELVAFRLGTFMLACLKRWIGLGLRIAVVFGLYVSTCVSVHCKV